jgi:hypothetical protein
MMPPFNEVYMDGRKITFVIITALSLAGCNKFIARNTATIEVHGARRPPPTILIDPSLKLESNESRKDWFWGTLLRQRVVIRDSGPLKLVPDTSLGVPDKVAVTNTATIEVYGKFEQPAPAILIDPSLQLESNESYKDNRDPFWGMDRKQRVVIRESGSLKLVPAAHEDIDK